ncbi:hypothetical protein PILCRDRAFT_64788 [Piloderma croceum F 1598]|uniref:DUF6699 domain-containing protein n=1 Tax=Piloderma croceum (strain F 1598) TaxID=765440 RepID=A0A0C3CAG7_PILCF|nr:hypothetical protein PILCRDRAFT_64788 [Piloderma croceum F 1598]
MTEILLNDTLAFTYPVVRKGESCPLIWDLRDPPSSAAQLVPYGQKHSTSFKFLQSQFATSPRVTGLYILCDLLPYPWKISARNQKGVTVGDVLEAIYQVARTPLTTEEWDRLPSKQRQRVNRVFDVRWTNASAPEKERNRGLKRVDCLLQSTRFAGLSMSYDDDFTCILTLSRNLD